MRDAKRGLNSLYFTQFLSSFADNLNFFLIIGILTRQGITHTGSAITNIQIGFLLAYVILAPLVGVFADKTAKSHVLIYGNLIKTIGIALLMMGVHPFICYTILGIGAVVYSPAKYGILTELTYSEAGLLRANSFVEGSTILAILLGTVTGGVLADISNFAGTFACLILYVTSLAFSFYIPKRAGNPSIQYGPSTREFFADMMLLFRSAKARVSLISTASFWMTTASLRIALIVWIPVSLGITNSTQQSMILGSVGVGVILSAILIPKLVPIGKLYRSYTFGFLMVASILVTAFVHSVILTVLLLILMGLFGGVFLIPMNTVLQEEGKLLIGAGKTIAIQNFVENSLTVSGLFFFMFIINVFNINYAVVSMGLLLLVFVLIISSQVRRLKSSEPEHAERRKAM